MTEALESIASSGSEFVSFRISDQEFCVEIMSIREIRGWTQETILPHAPEFVRGVINLRGTVLPIVDLAGRLGLGLTEPTPRHVIVVAQLGGQMVGLLVEAVSDILSLKDEDIQPPPDVCSELVKKFMRGVVSTDDRMINLIELEDVLQTAQEAVA